MSPFQYQTFISLSTSLKIQELRKPARLAIFSFLFYLENNPFDRGDATKIDQQGREYFLKSINKHILTFYTDHPHKEIRILSLKHINDI